MSEALDSGSENTMLPGPARDALTTAIRALELAEQHGHLVLRTVALSQVARCYRGLGLLDAAESYIFEALRLTQSAGSVDQTIELLCDAAEYAVARADAFLAEGQAQSAGLARERACDYCNEAATLARQCADPAWEVTVLLHVSDVLDRCGDHADAMAMQCRALDLIAKKNSQAPAPSAQLSPSLLLM